MPHMAMLKTPCKSSFCLKFFLNFFIWLLIAPQTQAIEISGSYRNLLFQHKSSINQTVTTDLNRFRLNLDGNHKAWQWRLSYDHELLYGGVVRDPIFAIAQQIPDATWLDINANIAASSAFNWQHSVYRGWLAYQTDAWQVTIGRQRLAWGSGRIWNPTDRFNPVQVTALEVDQKLGVDTAYITHSYSDFGSLQWVATPGSFKQNAQRKWALRWQDTIAQTDMALWLGEIGQERILAIDVTGNLGDAAGRLEWQQSWHGTQGNFGQLTLGLDGTWVSELFPEGLYLAAEYFYNGLAQPNTGLPLQTSMLHSSSAQLLGILAGYDLTPLWRMELTWLLDLNKTSWFMAPNLRWSASENMEVSCFAQFPSGNTGSEFSAFNDLLGINLEYYF
ncbi:MAG: hypothetical protein Q9M20_01295 [Mariprofundaceae bacterium]|nr:hypothetical protein [Mariprofundaceae bacterium]